uniref:RRM domain-containing protein n=1 Tax=Anolis carolinensis TaxID=28377 RepID=A0A803TCS6_ANOCA
QGPLPSPSLPGAGLWGRGLCKGGVAIDTTFTKIFVGGLPYHTTDASLRKYFEGLRRHRRSRG